MSEILEDRVYARHRRRTGAVLFIGAGAVGGPAAEEAARLGFSPIRIVDKDVLEVENLVRTTLGAEDLGKPKASSLAAKICRDFPLCDATGIHVDFMKLAAQEQRRLVGLADVVVAATDSVDCQRRVNQLCLAAEKPAVYPAVWVDDQRVRDAEVGEILWVLPGRHTPCYLCATAWRQAGADAQARGGTRVDIQVLVLATVQVVAALLDRTEASAGLLDPEQTCIYVHGFSPPSPAVRGAFQGPGLQSRTVHVPFPLRPCPACGASAATGAIPLPRDAPPVDGIIGVLPDEMWLDDPDPWEGHLLGRIFPVSGAGTIAALIRQSIIFVIAVLVLLVACVYNAAAFTAGDLIADLLRLILAWLPSAVCVMSAGSWIISWNDWRNVQWDARTLGRNLEHHQPWRFLS